MLCERRARRGRSRFVVDDLVFALETNAENKSERSTYRTTRGVNEFVIGYCCRDPKFRKQILSPTGRRLICEQGRMQYSRWVMESVSTNSMSRVRLLYLLFFFFFRLCLDRRAGDTRRGLMEESQQGLDLE